LQSIYSKFFSQKVDKILRLARVSADDGWIGWLTPAVSHWRGEPPVIFDHQIWVSFTIAPKMQY
jgi:hypothetical protein